MCKELLATVTMYRLNPDLVLKATLPDRKVVIMQYDNTTCCKSDSREIKRCLKSYYIIHRFLSRFLSSLVYQILL